MSIRLTLLGDGTTDRALVPIIEWVLRSVVPAGPPFGIEFSLGNEGRKTRSGLAGRIERAMREFPCDLLFVHRDAESEGLNARSREIEAAAAAAASSLVVCVVPVRMTESWLLHSEPDLRRAADNPSGSVPLAMPRVRDIEDLADPKRTLNELLIAASQQQGRRRKKLSRPSELAWRRVRLAELIEDFSALQTLPAFAAFYNATQRRYRELLDQRAN